MESLDVWTRDALALLGAQPGVRRVGLALAEAGGRRLRFTATDRRHGSGVDWCHVDADQDVPLNSAIATGQPVVGTVAALAERYPEFAARQPAAVSGVAAVPIRAGDVVLGGFVLFTAEPLPDPERLAALADGLALGLRQVQSGRRRLRPSLAFEPVPDGGVATAFLVPHDPREVRRARATTREVLAAWNVAEEACESATLCVSELVTNAFMHATSDCEVRLLLDEGLLTVTVRDGGVQPTAPGEGVTTSDSLEPHGRGLQVVAALADRWGSELDGVGTTAWFELRAD